MHEQAIHALKLKLADIGQDLLRAKGNVKRAEEELERHREIVKLATDDMNEITASIEVLEIADGGIGH